MPIYNNMPDNFYPRPNDVNAPLRSTIGIGPRGPKGHSITAEVIDTDPYGYFRVQFKDSDTGEVLVTTPNLDVGSRIFVTSERMAMNDTAVGVTHSLPSFDLTPLQASSDRGAVRVGDLIVFNAQFSDEALLSVDTFGIGVVNRVDNQRGDGTFVEYDVVHFVVTNVFTARLRDGAITTNMIADACITNSKLADGSVTSNKIGDSSITTEKLGNGSVTTNKLSNNSVTSQKLADGSVTTPKIANSAVTEQKLATGSVTNAKISNGSITTEKLANDSVTNAKIADNSVSSVKIRNGAITDSKLADGAVTTDSIRNGSVTLEKLSDGAINVSVPEFADPVEWNSTSSYDSLTIVTHEGSSYTSRQFVPAGTRIDNEDYWVLTGNYNAQVERYRQETIQKTFYFPTVAEMQESSDLTNGCVCITTGFHTINDGGGSTYYISDNGTVNGMDVIACQDDLNAMLIAHDKINVLQLGATEHDSESILQYALDNYHEIVFEGTFYVGQPLQLRHKVQLTGVNASLRTSSDIAIIEMDSTLDSNQQWALRDTYIANIDFLGNGTQAYGANATGYGLKIGDPENSDLINAPCFVIENCNFSNFYIGLYLEGYAHMVQSCEARNCKYGYYFIHPEQSFVLDSWANYCDVGLITNPIKEAYGHTLRIQGGAFQRCNVGIHILNLQDVYISTYHELNQNADVICGDPTDDGNYAKGGKNIYINSKSSTNSSTVALVQLYAVVYATINYVNYTNIEVPIVLTSGYCKYIEVNLCSELIRTTANACNFQGNSKGSSFCNVDHAMKVSPGVIPFQNVSNTNQVEIRQSRVSRARNTDIVQDVILNDAGYKMTLPRSQHGFFEIEDSENQSYLLFQTHTLNNYRYGLVQVPMRFKLGDSIYQLSRDADGFAKLDVV